jgi:hypothetical protein
MYDFHGCRKRKKTFSLLFELSDPVVLAAVLQVAAAVVMAFVAKA